ncbi:MAG: hypothetical protein AAF501_15825 [Pseudomonadota bacterium]
MIVVVTAWVGGAPVVTCADKAGHVAATAQGIRPGRQHSIMDPDPSEQGEEMPHAIEWHPDGSRPNLPVAEPGRRG